MVRGPTIGSLPPTSGRRGHRRGLRSRWRDERERHAARHSIEHRLHQCHSKLPEHLLGLSAIQLSHTGAGATIGSLSAAGMLTVPAPNGFKVPGSDPGTQAALGYLHANCGNCHNSSVVTVDLHLRLLVGQTSVESTDAFMSAVGKPTTNTADGGKLRMNLATR